MHSSHNTPQPEGDPSIQPPAPPQEAEASHEARDEGIIEKTARAFDGNIDEALKLGQIDRADRGVEATFQEGRRTEDSPTNRSVWNRSNAEMFASNPLDLPPEVEQRISDCVAVVGSDA